MLLAATASTAGQRPDAGTPYQAGERPTLGPHGRGLLIGITRDTGGGAIGPGHPSRGIAWPWPPGWSWPPKPCGSSAEGSLETDGGAAAATMGCCRPRAEQACGLEVALAAPRISRAPAGRGPCFAALDAVFACLALRAWADQSRRHQPPPASTKPQRSGPPAVDEGAGGGRCVRSLGGMRQP